MPLFENSTKKYTDEQETIEKGYVMQGNNSHLKESI